MIRNGLGWRDAPVAYGSHKTLYDRSVRRARAGVFDRILASPAERSGVPERIVIDPTHIRAHRTSVSLREEKGSARHRPGQDALNSELHAAFDGIGRPVAMNDHDWPGC